MLLLFFALWILFAGTFSMGICLSGACVTLLLYWFSRKTLGYRLNYDLLAFGRLWDLLTYLGYLLKEMLRAGFIVMKLIYTRGRDMEPLLVHFDTRLVSEGARSTLANSITLTAGTITVRDRDGCFLIHALDRSLAEDIEKSPFETRLLKLEGLPEQEAAGKQN